VDDGGSFKVEHGSDAAEVANVHKAGAGEAGDVVREREMRIESNTSCDFWPSSLRPWTSI